MINRVYVEENIRDHPRTRHILDRLPDASVYTCRRYGEVFNRKAQDFRVQKSDPALILAEKQKNFVLPVPDYCKLGEKHEYFYFSPNLNCIYDCRYCYLQGQYESAHHVVFVNFETFQEKIREKIRETGERDPYFFSGHVNDSLALDRILGFCDAFVPFFRERDSAWMELRTKSVQVASLRDRPPADNVVVAWSLSPEKIVQRWEVDTPGLDARLRAASELQEAGWPVGIRFDPVICVDRFQETYGPFIDRVFNHLDPARLHSVTLGPFRLPENGFQKMKDMFPEEELFAGPLENRDGVISYRESLEDRMLAFCRERIQTYISMERFYPAYESRDGSPV